MTFFLTIGAVLLTAAVVVMGIMIYRYIKGIRALGFSSGKRKMKKSDRIWWGAFAVMVIMLLVLRFCQ